MGGNVLFARDAGLTSVQSLVGKTDFDLAWASEQAQAFRRDDAEVMQSGDSRINFEEAQRQADGKLHWLQTSKIPLKGPDGQVIGMLGSYRDITDEKNSQLEIERQAHFDELTDLLNRRALQEMLDGHTRAAKKFAALLFIDLDHFKGVNDSFGHAYGDRLLQQVAERLKRVVSDAGVVARLGGDEFSVILWGSPDTSAAQAAESLASALLHSFQEPFTVGEHILHAGASIGISLFDDENFDASDKFLEADTAMYAAKAVGRNGFAFFTDALRQSAETDRLLTLRLRAAVENEQLHLAYQPQYDAQRRLVGVEALARWDDAELGSVPPGEFVPVAERTGLIHPMGKWVLQEAMGAVARWQRDFGFHGRMAVNVSALQFHQEDFELRCRESAQQAGVDPQSIELEFTESMLVDDDTSAMKRVHQLRDAGFRIALDDFGTGYSSLSYLTRLPVDTLKIDGSFVSRMLTDERDMLVVETILGMAKSLDIMTVAEGVETADQLSSLQGKGCEVFQGFYLAKPLVESEFVTLLRD